MPDTIRLKVSPPWVIYVHMLEAMFDPDPNIAFNVDYSEPSVTLSISHKCGLKAAAIAQLLPDMKYFGNVGLEINIDCQTMPNHKFVTAKELFEAAFENNPILAYVVIPGSEYWAVPFTYVVFKKEVVQFFCDNLNDPHGIKSSLYEDIAREIFDDMDYVGNGAGISYCTDIGDNAKLSDAPLGEWP